MPGMLGYVLVALTLAAQQAPVPQPFPRPGAVQPQAPTTAPPTTAPAAAPASGRSDVPTEATLGLPIYPAAQFIASYDAGRGQRYYIFGSAAPFTDLVAYYRTALKQKGEVIFESPATYAFEVGKFREESMAFPPGVTIKDYQSAVSEGYPNPKAGGQPARFRSILQFVAVTDR
jgi:hypothetical protein